MNRIIARFLLVLLFVGTFVPVTLAISADPPHACCMRKMHRDDERQLRGISHRHNCCGQLAVAQWAQPRPPVTDHSTQDAAALHVKGRPAHPDSVFHRGHSGRGPPVLFIA